MRPPAARAPGRPPGRAAPPGPSTHVPAAPGRPAGSRPLCVVARRIPSLYGYLTVALDAGPGPGRGIEIVVDRRREGVPGGPPPGAPERRRRDVAEQLRLRGYALVDGPGRRRAPRPGPGAGRSPRTIGRGLRGAALAAAVAVALAGLLAMAPTGLRERLLARPSQAAGWLTGTPSLAPGR
jgi:hypothetical protein